MFHKTSFLVLGLAASIALPGNAHAYENAKAAAKQIGALNMEAMEQYDLLEFEAAKKKLLEAVKVATDEGLIEDRVVARTYLNLGAVFIAGYKDRAKGLEAMTKALRIDAEVKMLPSIKNREVLKTYNDAKGALAAEKAAIDAKIAAKKKELEEKEKAERARVEKLLAEKAAAKAAKDAAAKKAGEAQVAEARARQEGSGEEKPAAKPAPVEDEAAAKTPKPSGPTLADASLEPDTVEGLKCPSAAELPAKRPLALRCALDKAVDAAAVFAFYRPIGREDFTPQIMKKSPKGWWEAVINGEMIVSPGVEVYFEARDKKGKPLAADGNATAPKQLQVRTASSLLRAPRVVARQDPSE